MSNYTQGKWELNMHDGNIYAGKQLVVQVYGATEHNQEANAIESFSNARLIVAAPEMYELLKVWTQIQFHPTLKEAKAKAKAKASELLARI